jgi:DMSO/TMAO reductase YedYZ molybdopterin-dependent catalytic subunit
MRATRGTGSGGDAPRGPIETDLITPEELRLAARNHAMPLEALRYPVTPVGLHYLLIHYDIPSIDPAAWRLVVDGRVRRQLSLPLSALRERPTRTIVSTMECAGNGRATLSPRPLSQPWLLEAVGTAEWQGVPLDALLDEAGPLAGAVEVLFSGADRGVEGGIDQHYQRSLPLDEARRAEVVLAYGLNGAPLPPQHGFPLRLVVPGWYGMTNVKWLTRITVLDEPFAGPQQARAYRIRQHEEAEGEPVTRIEPRSLMIPPGIPDFLTRRRTVPTGPGVLEGRAWSGWAPVALVEVSTDGGRSWAAAELGGDAASPWAWQSWSYPWEPPGPGEYELCSRASDQAGHVQPTEVVWNLGGYANNAVQRLVVTVVSC